MTELTPSVTTDAEPAVQTQSGCAAKTPALHGLYDPRNEHDACGVGFIAHMKGVKSHQIIQRRPRHAREPDASRRGRRRSADGRRRRRAGADPRPLLPRGAGQAGHRRCRRPATTASAICSCRRTPRCARISKTSSARRRSREGQPLIGFRDVPVDNSSLSKAPHIAASEPFHRQVFIGRTPDIDDDDEFERAALSSCAR